MNIQLPYGKEKMEISIPDARYNGSLISKMTEYVPEKSQEELVRDALAHPIGTPKLSEMAIGKKNVVIIASDHTRPVPSKIIMPQMLSEIRKGNPDADITILISTGLHRETTKEELVHKFGEDIVKAEKIVVHDCADESNLVDLGKLPSGGELIINKLAYEADLLVAATSADEVNMVCRRPQEHPPRHRQPHHRLLQPQRRVYRQPLCPHRRHRGQPHP
mgnify:CR=1 FL=1